MMRIALISALVLLVPTAARAQEGAEIRPWQGGYLGAALGVASFADEGDETIQFDTDKDGRFDDTVFTTAPADAFSPGFCDGFAQGTAPANGCEEDDEEFSYAVRGGYDWQNGHLLFGVIGEIGSMDGEDAVSAFSTTPARYTISHEIAWMAAARFRLGAAWDRFLFYGSAGVAVADVDYDFATSNGVNTFTESDEEDQTTGWQASLGVEWRIGEHFGLGLEYLHTELDGDDYTVTAGPPAPPTNPFILVNPAGTDLRRSERDIEVHDIRLTATYRF
jgi:outer membrane immunogenic protein